MFLFIENNKMDDFFQTSEYSNSDLVYTPISYLDWLGHRAETYFHYSGFKDGEMYCFVPSVVFIP